MNKLYCGLDVSDESTAICIMDAKGNIVHEAEVETELSAYCTALKNYKGVKCVVEASPLAETVCDWVEAVGGEIDILDPRKAKAVIKSKKKTDPLDAQKLAQLVRVGWYTKVHRKSGRSREIRTYLTARVQLVRTMNQLYSAIRGLLRAQGIRIKDGQAQFERRVLDALKERSETLQQAITPLLTTWKEMHAREVQMYRYFARKIVRKDPVVQLLQNEPGVGPMTAAAFVATIDDPTRFPSGEKVTSYLGLVPSVYQSGEVEIRGRITKQGDHLLRWLLVEAATTLLCRSKKDTPLQKWGLALKEKKGLGKAAVAVARKLAARLHYQWVAALEAAKIEKMAA